MSSRVFHKQGFSDGRRVRLVRCSDDYSTNPPGLEGTVTFVDDLGTVHVRCDNGSTRGLVPGVDR